MINQTLKLGKPIGNSATARPPTYETQSSSSVSRMSSSPVNALIWLRPSDLAHESYAAGRGKDDAEDGNAHAQLHDKCSLTAI